MEEDQERLVLVQEDGLLLQVEEVVEDMELDSLTPLKWVALLQPVLPLAYGLLRLSASLHLQCASALQALLGGLSQRHLLFLLVQSF